MGAWIEIGGRMIGEEVIGVAPFVGAWIEIIYYLNQTNKHFCRSLRGSVD